MTVHWSTPHHDGSSLYVANPHPGLDEHVEVRLRVPRASDVTEVMLRTYIDGEQSLNRAELADEDERDRWYTATVPMLNPTLNYRWLLNGGPAHYQWLNGTGVHNRDVTDAADFRLTTHPAPPVWASDAVLYQIFPDRFARSAAAVHRKAPPWAIPQDWHDPVIGNGPETPYQFYGGDLDGITEHLDHIASLGADTIYLTPFFPAQSNHRYDASSFDHADSLLGGDAALARLTKAAHDRGMRVMGDLTTNHCGAAHEWFRTAQADATAPEAGYFLFRTHPIDYVAWFDYPSLPKFDHQSPSLRRALYEGPGSVVGRWLRPPVALDGWRIDVANMTGRHGTTDVNHAVATAIRTTMTQSNPDSLLIAEHSHDASPDLPGDGWHGVMNYAAFTRPLWQWLTPAGPVAFKSGPFPVIPGLSGPDVVAAMREFTAAVPWQVAVTGLNLIGSHDTARIATTVGQSELLQVAFGLLAAMPGIPMLYAGDEIGQEGVNGEDGRRPFPWDRTDTWVVSTLAWVRNVFGERRRSPALRRGGLRWLTVADNALTFLRESSVQTVLVHATRTATEPLSLPVEYFGRRLAGLLGTRDVLADSTSLILPATAGPTFSWWEIP